MKWLQNLMYKLERKYPRGYIRNLMTVITVGMAIVYLIQMALPTVNITGYLTLNRAMLFKGQIWRLVTFLFVPPGGRPFMVLILLYVNLFMGRLLEESLGSWRFNFYYFTGAFFAVLCALILGSASTTYLNLSLFLAAATIMPDMTVRLFFIIPLKAKWLAIAYGVFLLIELLQIFIVSPLAGVLAVITTVFSLAHFLLFFGPSLISAAKQQILIYKNRRNWRNNNRY